MFSFSRRVNRCHRLPGKRVGTPAALAGRQRVLIAPLVAAARAAVTVTNRDPG